VIFAFCPNPSDIAMIEEPVISGYLVFNELVRINIEFYRKVKRGGDVGILSDRQ
jgi:hypothetical protein